LKRIIFTVTNDLNYDQRMQRICTSLAAKGFSVLLVGRKLKTSSTLSSQIFSQKRISCYLNNGFPFYAEYNFRLFWWLLFQKTDCICAIDLDTILPCYFVSLFNHTKRVYDAHELFTEMKEVVTRKRVHAFWLSIEKYCVPKFSHGYTVSASIAEELKRRYGVQYSVIRNVPLRQLDVDDKHRSVIDPQSAIRNEQSNIQQQSFFLYQGAVNEARGLESLVVAMQFVNRPLHIYGDGNLFEEIKGLILKYKLGEKVILKGKIDPKLLHEITLQAYAGINLVEPLGLNQVYSLANKFFDYIQAALPQLTMNFPEYKRVNDKHQVAVLIDEIDPGIIAEKLNLLLNDEGLYQHLKQNCKEAAIEYNWQNEEIMLTDFYKNIFEE
jgi:glycosyltransferase involved in cell wall biosynthesis